MTYGNISPVRLKSTAKGPASFVFSNLSGGGVNGGSMNTTGAGSAKTFRYTVPAGNKFEWYRTTVMMHDTGIDGSTYGGVASLATGVQMVVVDSDETVLIDFTSSLDSGGIKQNAQWGLLAGVDVNITTGSVQDTVLVRWTIANAAGGPMLLKAGQYIAAVVRDDLTGITRYQTQVQGSISSA